MTHHLDGNCNGETATMGSLRHFLIAAVLIAMVLGPAATARAQDRDGTPERPGAFFLGGSVVLWNGFAAKVDPPGGGYLEPYYYGQLESPAVGATLGGGVFVARSWSVGGELAIRPSRSAAITEYWRAKFESSNLSSLYTDREQLISAMIRGHVRHREALDFQPLGGLTVSRSSQSLTDRHGVYEYYGGRMPIQRADVRVDYTRIGFVGGVDLQVHRRRRTAFTCGARLHWIGRQDSSPKVRKAPVPGPIVFHVGAGIRWQR